SGDEKGDWQPEREGQRTVAVGRRFCRLRFPFPPLPLTKGRWRARLAPIRDPGGGGVGAIAKASLPVHPLQVRADGGEGELESGRDLFVGEALRDQLEDLRLTAGERLARAFDSRECGPCT